jgi:hypothetical protein
MNQSSQSRTETASMLQLKQLLDQCKLADWWTILTAWLPHYDGWLSIMEASDDAALVADDSPAEEIISDDAALVADDSPAEEIIALLQKYPVRLFMDDVCFATGISELEFLYRRARLVRSGRRWSSLEESFLAYAITERGEIPHVYEYGLHPESVTKYWLLGKLHELRTVPPQESRSRTTRKSAG